MKTKKCFFAAVMICLFATATFAQKGIQKILIAAVEPGESNMVFYDLPGEVEVKAWDRNYIRVEIAVKTNLKNEEVFNYLKEIGRYNIEKSYNSYYFLVLNLPNLEEEVSVNGNDLEETFSFIITTPWDIDIDHGGQSDMVVDYDSDEKEGNVLLADRIKY